MRDYEYQPLGPGEIRLLRLEAARPDEPLSGTILHHRLRNPVYRPRAEEGDADGGYLEHALAYEAISYHWGADNQTPFDVVIDHGSVIRITASLHTILRRLVLPDGPRVLWADAICINQVTSADNREKGEQIQMMPDIYRIASCVQVYLGPGADDVALALDFIRSIADYSEYLDTSQHDDGETATALAQQRGFVLPPVGDPRWPALRAFLRRPWFRRVWIIQEFVYATDVAVTCGDHDIDWHLLWLCAKAYADNRQLIYTGYSPDLFGTRRLDLFREAHEGARAMLVVTDLRMRAWGYMTPTYMILSLNENRDKDKFSGLSIRKDLNAIKEYERFAKTTLLHDRAKGETFPFGRPDMLQLLRRTSNFLATQPVDRLYALLGLAGTDHIKPVYSEQQTLNVVATKFAAHFMTTGSLSEVLSTAGVRSATPSPNDPPSWVPNWTKMTYSQDMQIGFNRLADIQDKDDREKDNGAEQPAAGDEATVREGEKPTEEAQPREKDSERLYSASGALPQVFHINELEASLTIKVTPVDRVVLVLPGQLCLGTPMYLYMAQKLGPVYADGQPIEEAFWRTLIGNRTWNGLAVPDRYAAQYVNLKRHETGLLARAMLLLVIVALIALPFVTIAIRCIPFTGHVGLVTAAVAWKVSTVSGVVLPGIVYLTLLPLFRWLWITALVPLLVVIAWYLAAKVYPLLVLDALKYIGVTTAASIGSVPEDCTEYLTSFMVMGNRYNLCFTEGRLMGLLPLLTKEGDIVVIVHGCHAPFVVRPTRRQGYYKLVGECYVHGVMNGELAASESIDIVLC
ncbi:hypothetical protein JDV02_008930 [Purpureocillium takamizusanense]|uniref:Heterokaryon incompatibility domain-containing protein n=1 Tax=Purpureocillium takamizusanense TaxID=2060973 RepID=A0A9Q8VF71_9HYPO|nr:uncharacterized protein JDV02_008930 [Purpureocillium takamizusanense]UNI23091.1 hypothetical protein JDV02_008930 [Purpureocillium takamizusanense]